MGNHCTSIDKDEIGPPDMTQDLHSSESQRMTRAKSKLVKRDHHKTHPHHHNLYNQQHSAALADRNLKRKFGAMATNEDSSKPMGRPKEPPNWTTLASLHQAIGERYVVPARKPDERRNGEKDEMGEEGEEGGETDDAQRLFVVPPPEFVPGTQGSATDFGLGDYKRARADIRKCEEILAFDYKCRINASETEKKADHILQLVKQRDVAAVYDAHGEVEGYGGQKHGRHVGDHFLSNVDLIAQTKVLEIARHMPKGAHLHIHYNACLKPYYLLSLAEHQDRMFIMSKSGPLIDENSLRSCEIQFLIRSEKVEQEAEKERQRMGQVWDIFDPKYKKGSWMKYSAFRAEFPRRIPEDLLRRILPRRQESTPGTIMENMTDETMGSTMVEFKRVDQYLQWKLVFNAEEAHGVHQTVQGAWDKFNGRTRMMKGLFNYKTAFEKYTYECLQDFVRDGIQYAEIRPNFMQTNQVWLDDGSTQLDNREIMGIIQRVLKQFQKDQAAKKGARFFLGIKVIYCTPRSFSPAQVKQGLDECRQFKKDWPDLIAGFDLVGEEAAGRPLKDFTREFLEFQYLCKQERLEIPFLFHCGETLEMGSDTDGNLSDALLLRSKRIGHGFALPRHPYILEEMKDKGICVETCPISNEVLGLTPRVSGHSVFGLLSYGVPCTINSDNGTLFKSTLSHDFYQVMTGKADMSLFGWKQLILWSLEFACLNDNEMKLVLAEWEKLWEEFLDWMIRNKESLLEMEQRPVQSTS